MREALVSLSFPKIARALLFVLVFFYLGFHALSGDRGVYAWLKENRRLELLQAELTDTMAKRQDFERKISLLRASSLDLDMLDEQARAVLGFAGTDEVVILNQQ